MIPSEPPWLASARVRHSLLRRHMINQQREPSILTDTSTIAALDATAFISAAMPSTVTPSDASGLTHTGSNQAIDQEAAPVATRQPSPVGISTEPSTDAMASVASVASVANPMASAAAAAAPTFDVDEQAVGQSAGGSRTVALMHEAEEDFV